MISLILQHFLSQNMVGLLREEGWRWIVERLVTLDKVSEGGHLSFFFLFFSPSYLFRYRNSVRKVWN